MQRNKNIKSPKKEMRRKNGRGNLINIDVILQIDANSAQVLRLTCCGEFAYIQDSKQANCIRADRCTERNSNSPAHKIETQSLSGRPRILDLLISTSGLNR